MNEQVFYHYTTDIAWRIMLGEKPAAVVASIPAISVPEKNQLLRQLNTIAANGQGLQPANWFVQGPRIVSRIFLPSQGNKKVVEGLLTPEPQEWIAKADPLTAGRSFFGYFIEDFLINREDSPLKKHASHYVLIKVTVTQAENFYVADIAALTQDVNPHMRRLHHKFSLSAMFGAVAGLCSGAQRYWKSLTPLADYPGQGSGYELPVVIGWSAIPAHRLEAVKILSHEDMRALAQRKPAIASRPSRPLKK